MSWFIILSLVLLLMCVVHAPPIVKQLSYIQMLVDEGPVIPKKFLKVTEDQWTRSEGRRLQGRNANGELPRESDSKLQAFARVFESRHSTFKHTATEPFKYARIKDRPSSLSAVEAIFDVLRGVPAVESTPIEVADLDADAPCDKRDALLKLARHNSPEYQEMLNESTFETLLSNVESYTGETATAENLMELVKMVDSEHQSFQPSDASQLMTEAAPFVKKLGKFNLGLFPQPMRVNEINLGEEIRKSRVSRLFSQLLDLVDTKKGNRRNKEKMLTITTVSTTIQSILMAFGLSDRIESYLPTAGAAVVFEFYDNLNYFKLLYSKDGTTIEELTAAIGCTEYCEYKKFDVILSKYSDNLFDCQVTDPDMYTIPTTVAPTTEMSTPAVTDPPTTVTMATTTANTTSVPPVILAHSRDCKDVEKLALASCDGPNWSTVIFFILALFFLVGCGILGYLLHKERKAKKQLEEDHKDRVTSLEADIQRLKAEIKELKMDPELLHDWKKIYDWLVEILNKTPRDIADEFIRMADWRPEDASCTKSEWWSNRKRNRYPDQLRLEAHHVPLRRMGKNDDYIHANYVGTVGYPERFICTQAPLPNTMVHFWKMVIDERCLSIVMLCKVEECDQYWPNEDEKPRQFESKDEDGKPFQIIVKIEGETTSSDKWGITTRTFKVGYAGCDGIIVTQYQWDHWDDNGIPFTKKPVFEIMKEVCNNNKEHVVVHCTNGVGRTGTFVGIGVLYHHIIDSLTPMDEKKFDNLLHFLRQHRLGAVENELQYAFIYDCIVSYYVEHEELMRKSLNSNQLKLYATWNSEQLRLMYDKEQRGGLRQEQSLREEEEPVKKKKSDGGVKKEKKKDEKKSKQEEVKKESGEKTGGGKSEDGNPMKGLLKLMGEKSGDVSKQQELKKASGEKTRSKQQEVVEKKDGGGEKSKEVAEKKEEKTGGKSKQQDVKVEEKSKEAPGPAPKPTNDGEASKPKKDNTQSVARKKKKKKEGGSKENPVDGKKE